MYQLAPFSQHNVLDTVDISTEALPGNHKDIEHLYRKANLHLSQIPPKWVHHSCDVKGCKEGLATIDGNEKIRRSMCAAPKSKVTTLVCEIFVAKKILSQKKNTKI